VTDTEYGTDEQGVMILEVGRLPFQLSAQEQTDSML
jgi:hypothetical protein